MSDIQMGAVETRFAEIIWKWEPISAAALAKHAEQQLSWKKTTSYTVLKRLCDKGIFKNEGGIVSSLIPREEFYALQSERFVAETFDGSLPAFLAAFTARKALTDEEIACLRRMIEDHKEG
ncbi:MAG: BlaI/MecI/CopY family transcriptional regulator [Clostridia bacterium]|nr:BlaI/MecI/CopY family transcriptional regulator [Clostridia bacterium]